VDKRKFLKSYEKKDSMSWWGREIHFLSQLTEGDDWFQSSGGRIGLIRDVYRFLPGPEGGYSSGRRNGETPGPKKKKKMGRKKKEGPCS